MSAAADDVRAFRAADEQDHFRAHVIDQLGELREAVSLTPTAEQIGQAVAQHMRSMLRDPDTWADASEGMSEAAQRQAGRWLWGGIRKGFSKASWVFVIAFVVYQLGGWTALVAFFKGSAGQ